VSVQKKSAVPPEKLVLYQRLLDSVEGIETKSNFGSAYTAINGNMYSIISKHGVVGIRLPEPDRTAFLEKYEATAFRGDPAWPPAKEYVAVPDDLLPDTKTLTRYLETSLKYARTLRPKATKKRASP